MSRYETLHLKPNAVKVVAPLPPRELRHVGIFQDLSRRTAKPPFVPSPSLAFRLLVFCRIFSAVFSFISDCDETYNYWEPFAFFLGEQGAFRTWEYSAQWRIRSWAYIALHAAIPAVVKKAINIDRRTIFIMTRISIAIFSAICETCFYASIRRVIHVRVARYYLFISLASSGMWSATTAFLPSSFAMSTTMLAYHWALQPASLSRKRGTSMAVLCFAIGAIVGWPFAAAVAIPFVVEQMFVFSGDSVATSQILTWRYARFCQLLSAAAIAFAVVLLPVLAFDSWAYGSPSLVSWNIVKYNLVDSSPNLYGTEPFHWYILNLLLNFNIAYVLALLSIPCLALTFIFDRTRLGYAKGSINNSSPFTLISLRLAPVYCWMAIFFAQPHKEERFMYPIYPLIVLNASMTLYLLRGLLERLYVKKYTLYQAGQTKAFTYFTRMTIMLIMTISLGRIYSLGKYYRAHMMIPDYFSYVEVPKLLGALSLLPAPITFDPRHGEDKNPSYNTSGLDQIYPAIRVCYGSEWYRFPTTLLFTRGLDAQFIRSDFNGQLPGKWDSTNFVEAQKSPANFNGLNEEEVDRYVLLESCDYLVDLSVPSKLSSTKEPNFKLETGVWEAIFCLPYLDNNSTPSWARILQVPLISSRFEVWGEYCLLGKADRFKMIPSRVIETATRYDKQLL